MFFWYRGIPKKNPLVDGFSIINRKSIGNQLEINWKSTDLLKKAPIFLFQKPPSYSPGGRCRGSRGTSPAAWPCAWDRRCGRGSGSSAPPRPGWRFRAREEPQKAGEIGKFPENWGFSCGFRWFYGGFMVALKWFYGGFMQMFYAHVHGFCWRC